MLIVAIDSSDLHLRASHGASLEQHDPPDTTLKRLISNETTRQIRSQGNLGVVGMDALRDKGKETWRSLPSREQIHKLLLITNLIVSFP